MSLREQSDEVREAGNEYQKRLREFRENIEGLAKSQLALVANGKSIETGQPFGWLREAETKADESLEALDKALEVLHGSAAFGDML